jgi:hypothetical protein
MDQAGPAPASAVLQKQIMKTHNKALVAELRGITDEAITTVSGWRHIDPAMLNKKPNAEAWSMLECLEHLNLYGDFYLPEIEKRLVNAQRLPGGTFKPGMIGNYFAGLMKPREGKIKKMKSPRDKNPAGSTLNITTIERFLKQAELLKKLLAEAENADLTRTKTAISLSKLVKLRLGDTLRFYVYHIERHVLQAARLF